MFYSSQGVLYFLDVTENKPGINTTWEE